MKIILRCFLVLAFLLTFNPALKAQINIDETNLITQLTGLNALSCNDAIKYLSDRDYKLVSKQTVPQATYAMDLYKYRITNQTRSFLFSVISDKVVSSGIITYSEDEYQQALKTIKSDGFEPGEATTPESGKTVYAKGNVRFIVQKKLAANNSIFYVMMLSDIYKIAQLIGTKK